MVRICYGIKKNTMGVIFYNKKKPMAIAQNIKDVAHDYTKKTTCIQYVKKNQF